MSVSVLNTDAGLSGKTLDLLESDQTISGLKTFSRSPNAPFAVAAGSANVPNLDADKLDGLDSTYFLSATNLSSGTIPTARLGITAPASTTSTGNQDDFATGLSFAAGLVSTLRCNNATILTLRGIAGGVDGAFLRLISVGAGQVDLAHQNSNSTAANRIINFATSANTSLAAGSGIALLVYDGTTARWRLVEHEQGAWITPTFAGGDFTASSGTWTVASGDRTAMGYWLKGRTLTVRWTLISTTVSATPNILQIGNGQWGGFTAAGQFGTVCNAQANRGTTSSEAGIAFIGGNMGVVGSSPGTTTIGLGRGNYGGGGWATTTDTTDSWGTFPFEVT